ncbi:MAG TPA: M48 family metalloprotease, partial [Alphaproteobacteria bacterium]|nr:M48 family metalloprotease [Alphaproteobacteria bacterium]
MILRRGLSAALLLAALASALTACADSPVTGRNQVLLMSQAQEEEIGARQNPVILRSFGGVYDDPELLAYVERVGARLVAGSEQPDQPFTFTVLDSDIVNALALPGGYIYVTRGLLTLANSEAELASVLAHEIAHVTARHPAERYSQSALARLGIGLIGVATGSDGIAELAGFGAQAYLRSYSRDQESEADVIGIRYLAAAGYDPDAMAGFLAQMERHAQLHALVTGEESAAPGFLSTHPQTTDRMVQAVQVAATAPDGGAWGHAEYLAAIDGMVYGEGAGAGQVRGRTYADPAQGFLWDAPPGYWLRRSGDTVLADGPADSRIVFDTVT